MTACLLANRHRVAPFGLSGGDPGQVGAAWVERGDGSTEKLGSTASVAIAPGDTFVIETPGGGGYGKAG
jgi:5-oxoprolinase (ATP-hydrolysing)